MTCLQVRNRVRNIVTLPESAWEQVVTIVHTYMQEVGDRRRFTTLPSSFFTVSFLFPLHTSRFTFHPPTVQLVLISWLVLIHDLYSFQVRSTLHRYMPLYTEASDSNDKHNYMIEWYKT